MKRAITAIAMTAIWMSSLAQGSVDDVLREIEQNNATLKALRMEKVATKAANHTGLALDDPEMEFAYLWGSPSTIGGRKDFSVSQSFDMATLTGARKRLAMQQDNVAEWQYRQECRQVMLEARWLCIDIVYYNAMMQELRLRLDNAKAIADIGKKQLDNGETTRLDYNSVVLDLAQVKGEMARLEAERNAALALLQGMNGGNSVTLAATRFPDIVKVGDFDAWYAAAAETNPVLVTLKEQVAAAERQVALSRSEGMPKLTAGFMGEYVSGEKYQGVTVGMSIPLWSNRRKVRLAKAEVEAARARREEACTRIYAAMKSLFARQAALRSAADTLGLAIKNTDNTSLLKKALDAGTISVGDYLIGTRMYYSAKDQEMETWRQWHRAWAELTAFDGQNDMK